MFSKRSARAWGDRRLPPRSTPGGGSLHCLSLSLALERGDGVGTCQPATVGRGDFQHQPQNKRGINEAWSSKAADWLERPPRQGACARGVALFAAAKKDPNARLEDPPALSACLRENLWPFTGFSVTCIDGHFQPLSPSLDDRGVTSPGLGRTIRAFASGAKAVGSEREREEFAPAAESTQTPNSRLPHLRLRSHGLRPDNTPGTHSPGAP